MRSAIRLITVTVFVLSVSFGVAQTATSSLRGTITDPGGAIIVGATVTLESKDTGFHLVHKTDKDGSYQFQQVPPATYKLTVDSSGFESVASVVQLLVSQPSTLNLAMRVSSSNTTVEVDASVSEILDTTNAAVGNAVEEKTVEALPMEGRNVPDLLSLQPGVLYLGHENNQDGDSRSGAVAGARSDEGNITLDGLDNNSIKGYAFTGVLRSTIDSVDEFKVTTSNNGADSGRSSGAQVNVVTRSGTNQLHGSLYEYNRNTATSANDWFNKESEAAEGLPNKPGELIRNTFGAALGGPIRKDKLYYFLNFEMQRTAEAQEEKLIVPNAAFRNGTISYYYTNPGGGQSVETLSPSQFAALDPHCSANGTCPWGPGANPNILKVFQSYPLPNGSLAGDGLNTGSFTWAAPNPLNLWTNIARIDYAISDRHHLFGRANLQDDTQSSAPQFPGQSPAYVTRDNTKGFAVGEIWTIGQNLVNNARYGFSRQGYSQRGASDLPWVTLASVSNPTAETYSTIVHVPIHNVVDDVSWTHGKHNFQFGVNYRLVTANTNTNNYSFDSGASSGGEYFDSLANTGQDLDPGAFGLPAVATSFDNSYSYAAMNLAGIVAQSSLNYVYTVTPQKTGTLLPVGSFVDRNFKSNQFEYYLEDSFRITPKLTITYGIRHSLNQTPYETGGQQVSPSVSMRSWFNTRVSDAAKGVVDQPNFTFIPSGKANGGKPLYDMDKWDIAPRVGVAYAFNNKTSVRAGFGENYDNFGMSIANQVATLGSAGLLGSESTLAGWVTTGAAPRFTGLNDVPLSQSGLLPPSGTLTFPFTPPPGAEAFSNVVDDGIKTPHSAQIDFSVQREVPGSWTLEALYVGRFGRRTLQNMDFGMPLDLVDPASGMDYFQAADAIEKEFYASRAEGIVNPRATNTAVAPIAYWEDLFPDAAGAGPTNNGTAGQTATQNVFDHFAANPRNASYGIYSMDVLCNPGCGGTHNRFYASQYSSLETLSSIGTSSYHSGQLIMRHPMRHGLQVDASYTFGKSIDLGSDAERAGGGGGSPSSFTYYSTFSQILDAFHPKKNKAVSDYDVRHLATGSWVYELPFGRGREFLPNSNRVLNAVIGGWQNSGLARITSGLPFGDQIGAGWVTSWNYQSFIVKQGRVAMHKHVIPGAGPEVFANPDQLAACVEETSCPVRYPIPGETGSRNAFRGDGFFGIDSGLNKSWKVTEHASLNFGYEVFNLTNSVRFDVNPNTSLQSVWGSGDFGVYSATLTHARIQQFSLRASF
ncbi:MAG TPA: TonB-dependent receptor [Terracidiphilus sp.]|jgi:hypothetical protein